jgi:hypothetical protein
MAELGVLLLVHGEVTDPEVDMFDREAVFIDTKLVSSIVHDVCTDVCVVMWGGRSFGLHTPKVIQGQGQGPYLLLFQDSLSQSRSDRCTQPLHSAVCGELRSTAA